MEQLWLGVWLVGLLLRHCRLSLQLLLWGLIHWSLNYYCWTLFVVLMAKLYRMALLDQCQICLAWRRWHPFGPVPLSLSDTLEWSDRVCHRRRSQAHETHGEVLSFIRVRARTGQLIFCCYNFNYLYYQQMDHLSHVPTHYQSLVWNLANQLPCSNLDQSLRGH